MFHLAVFQYTAANTGAGVYVTVPAISESFLTRNASSRFILPPPGPGIPGNWRIGAMFAMGPTMTTARINNATLRQLSLPAIEPIYPTATVEDNVRFPPFIDQGPALPPTDEFGIEADAAAVEVQTGGLWLHDGQMGIAKNAIFSVRYTAAVAVAVGIWQTGTITLEQTLPVGRYQIVGATCRGVNAAMFRIVFPYGGPRPGSLCSPGATVAAQLAITPDPLFRVGRFGSWGEFDSIAQPQIEILGTGTTTVQAGVLDLIRVR